MSTPLASRTTISSRNKMALLKEGNRNQEVLNSQTSNNHNHNNNNYTSNIDHNGATRTKTSMQPPSQIARSRALKTPSTSATRIANLAYGLPTSARSVNKLPAIKNNVDNNISSIANSTRTSKTHPSIAAIPIKAVTRSSNAIRLPPHTTAKITMSRHSTTKTASSSHTRNISNSNLNTPKVNSTTSLNSRSSSILSSVSTTTSKATTTTSKRPSLLTNDIASSARVPSTNVVRKGLAKFSNPIECQRQFQSLSLKIRQLNEIVDARDKEVDQLQDQLNYSVKLGVGFATTVQYFDSMLKLDSDTNLLQECKQLQLRVSELTRNELDHENKIGAIIEDYKAHLQVEKDLRNTLEKELEETHISYKKTIESLESKHKNELIDLSQTHSSIQAELETQLGNLKSDLTTKLKELTELRTEHETLSDNYNKLEESLTKSKDARIKYAQDKIHQLQKDVESLNSVLEMRSERIHALEKDSILLSEVQGELMNYKDSNKSLSQQIESIQAALDKKREQFENLMVEKEKIQQELKRERKERRRMTMRTEQLEYVLNESCAAESTLFSSSMRDLDSADHLV